MEAAGGCDHHVRRQVGQRHDVVDAGRERLDQA